MLVLSGYLWRYNNKSVSFLMARSGKFDRLPEADALSAARGRPEGNQISVRGSPATLVYSVTLCGEELPLSQDWLQPR